MTDHNQMVWQGAGAREIMRSARERFKEASKEDLPGAYVSLASDHYSLVKRYLGFRLPMAAWHLFRAANCVSVAIDLNGKDITRFSANQLDVMSRVMLKAPGWLGGDRYKAKHILEYALSMDEMPEHTRGLMFISLRDILWGDCDVARAWGANHQARNMLSFIDKSEVKDAPLQYIRVALDVGLFSYDHGDLFEKSASKKDLREAYGRAYEHSRDQLMKVVREFRRRGIELHDLDDSNEI